MPMTKDGYRTSVAHVYKDGEYDPAGGGPRQYSRCGRALWFAVPPERIEHYRSIRARKNAPPCKLCARAIAGEGGGE